LGKLQWMAKVPMAPMTANQAKLHLVSAWASEHRLVLAQAKVQDKSNEITAIPALLELLDLAGCSHTRCDGDSKILLISLPQVQIIFSVLNQIIPRCFNRWNSGFSKCRRMAPYPPHVNTPLSLDITASTRTVWTLSVDSFAPLSSRRGLLHCHRGTDSSVMEQNHPRCSSTSAVCRQKPQTAAIRQHWGLQWILDVTVKMPVGSPCTHVAPSMQSSRLKQTKPQAEV